jgi:tetrahydromethanopterin S-methyltransferase subunit F
MKSDDSCEQLREAIKKSIKAQVDGRVDIDQARKEYSQLYSRYRSLESGYISDRSRGYLKGLLYHHNMKNHALLSAVFDMKGGKPDPVLFTGDRLLLSAIPEMISRLHSEHEEMVTLRTTMSREEPTAFELIFIKGDFQNGRFCIAAVSASPSFEDKHFELCAHSILAIFKKHYNSSSAVSVSYINALSREIGHLLEISAGTTLLADHFIMEKLADSFGHTGIKKVIKISEFIVRRLEEIYPANVHVIALSLSHFVVIYDKETVFEKGFKRNRIDFEYMENNIPYRVKQTEIKSPESIHYYLKKQ